MKQKQYIHLIACVITGILWIYIGQNIVLLELFGDLLSDEGGNLMQYLDDASSPAFQALWFSCIAAMLIWIATTTSKVPMNSAEVRAMRPTWWICATALVLLGWLYQVVFTVLIWQFTGTAPIEGVEINYYSVPAGGWATLLILVVLDVALLFWVPTMLATPKSYRLVVPGTLKFLGGR